MSAQFDDVLNKCIEDIIDQRQTVESCLVQYPELAASLRPLLQLASLVSSASKEDPDPTFRAATKTRFLEAAEIRYKKRRSRGLFAHLQRAFALPLAPVGAVLVFLIVTASGSVMVSADSLPDEPLYPVKRAVERVQLALAFGDDGKADRYLLMARRRLAEMSAISEEHGRLDTDVVRSMSHSTDKAIDHLEKVTPKSGHVEEVEDLVTREETVLRAVSDKAPREALPSLEQALAASARGHRWANLVQQKIDGTTPVPNVLPTAMSPTSIKKGDDDARITVPGNPTNPAGGSRDDNRGEDDSRNAVPSKTSTSVTGSKDDNKGEDDGDRRKVGSPLPTVTNTTVRFTPTPVPAAKEPRDGDDRDGQTRTSTPTPDRNEDERPVRTPTPTPTKRDEHPTTVSEPTSARDGDDDSDDRRPAPTPTSVPSRRTTPVLNTPTKVPTAPAREIEEVNDDRQKATPVPTKTDGDQNLTSKRTPTPTKDHD